MSNILNSHNNYINNAIPAKKLSDNQAVNRCITAPTSIPRYSIDKIMQEKEEFRRSCALTEFEQRNKKTGKTILKLGVILSAVAAFFLLKGKK